MSFGQALAEVDRRVSIVEPPTKKSTRMTIIKQRYAKYFLVTILAAIIIIFSITRHYATSEVRYYDVLVESAARYVNLSVLPHVSASNSRHSSQEKGVPVDSATRFVDVSRSSPTSRITPHLTASNSRHSLQEKDVPVDSSSATRVVDVNGSSPISRIAPRDRLSNSTSNNDISVYLEMFEKLQFYYEGRFSEVEKKSRTKCPLPNNAVCIYQHTDKMADVVFRFIYYYNPKAPFRYHDGQLVAILNSEAETPNMMEPLRNADIRIDHHITSEITLGEACLIPWKEGMYKTPDPSKRKGVAMFMSNCKVKWRNDYILELAKYIHIHSYGGCWHNVSARADRKDWTVTRYSLAKKHRIVVTFENTINHDYISEKITWSYEAGAIPVYWGPPEIYLWTPGNHTFIDPQRFKGPKELAEYLKRVDEDDDLFRYHTTNFNYSVAGKTHRDNCYSEPYWCKLCSIAYNMKMDRVKN